MTMSSNSSTSMPNTSVGGVASDDEKAMSFVDMEGTIQSLINLLIVAKSSIHSPSPTPHAKKLYRQLDVVERSLVYLEAIFFNFEKNVNNQLDILKKQSHVLYDIFRTSDDNNVAYPSKEFEGNVETVSDTIMRMKLKVHPSHRSHESGCRVITVRGDHVSNLINELVKLPFDKFRGCVGYDKFEENFEGLEPRLKLCLFCFAAFPENAIVRKSLLMYWWVGEGFIDPRFDGEKTADDVADAILKEFLDKGFIELATSDWRVVGFRMHPLIRYAVAFLADKSRFFSFDSVWNADSDFSSCNRSCLIRSEDECSRRESMNFNPEKLITLFNVDDPRPNLDPKWFSKMRDVCILSLGKWQKSIEAGQSSNPVELASSEFLTRSKNMKNLKFLGLKGISGISMLPDSIERLTNLMVLDLNSCQDLELLPDNISSLKNLTHLDVSNCHNIRYMPKSLESLTKIEVLKGFVVFGDSVGCSLHALARFMRLRKLGIDIMCDNLQQTALPNSATPELSALEMLGSVRKLTITWRWRDPAKSNYALELARLAILELPKNLEKIDIRNYPGTTSPIWMVPSKLEPLRKIYIDGGTLSNLYRTIHGRGRWNVMIIRLRNLPGLSLAWEDLQHAFPDLIYLEKFECSLLCSFPCDGNGVWLDREKLSEQQQHHHLRELGWTWSVLSTVTT